jgi:hypothetical protein
LGRHKKHQPDPGKPKYQPTEREQAVLASHANRLEAAAPVPRLTVVSDDRSARMSLDHPDSSIAQKLLMEALGTADSDFADALLLQLGFLSTQGNRIDKAQLDFMLAVVKGIKANDQLEAMLAIQMAVIHLRMLQSSELLNRTDTPQQSDSVMNGLNKLARTYTAQMEALKRYRTGGEQKVTVQHVSVAEGGQAIVGNVTQATRQTVSARRAKTTLALSNAQQTAMPIIDEPKRVAVPARQTRKNDAPSSA